MQDVQAGLLVNPVFAYSPYDAGKLGIPPLSMQTKDKEIKNMDYLAVGQAKGAKPTRGKSATRRSVDTKSDKDDIVE